MLECVPNVSAGRDIDVIAGLAASCGPPLLDVHADADHNRSVFTLAAPDAGVLTDAVRGLAREVAARVSIVGARRRPPAIGRTRRGAVRRAHRRHRGGDASGAGVRALVGDVLRGTRVLLRRGRRGTPDVARGSGGRVPAARARSRAPRSRTRSSVPPRWVCARLWSRSTACSTPPTWRPRARVARGGARTRRRPPGCACPRVLPRRDRPRAGLDERHRPRAHRDRARVRSGARRACATVARMSTRWSWSGCCRGPSSSAARPTFRAWTGLDEASTIEARIARGPT